MYAAAKENITFEKYPALLELDKCHGVDIGDVYETKDSAAQFTKYIAERQRQAFLGMLSSAKFYSFLMNGSMGSGTVEDELILLLFCLTDHEAMEIQSCARYFSVEVPKKADTPGFMSFVSNSLDKLGIEHILDKASILAAADSGNLSDWLWYSTVLLTYEGNKTNLQNCLCCLRIPPRHSLSSAGVVAIETLFGHVKGSLQGLH